MSDEHAPFNDDGILYCGYDGHGGCGEAWPCSFERRRTSLNTDGVRSMAYDPDENAIRWALRCACDEIDQLRADLDRSQILIRIAQKEIARLRGEPFTYEATVTGGYAGGEVTQVEMVVDLPTGPVCDTCGRSGDLVWLEEPNGSRDGWFCRDQSGCQAPRTEPGYSAEAPCRLCLHPFSDHDEHGCHAPGPFYAAIECECMAPITVPAQPKENLA